VVDIKANHPHTLFFVTLLFRITCYRLVYQDSKAMAVMTPHALAHEVFSSIEEADEAIREMVEQEGNSIDDINIGMCAMGVKVKDGFLRVETVDDTTQ
jgi:hypothetical protein